MFRIVCVVSLILGGNVMADEKERDRDIDIAVAVAKAKFRKCLTDECKSLEAKVEQSVNAAKKTTITVPPKTWRDTKGNVYYVHPDGISRSFPPKLSRLESPLDCPTGTCPLVR